MLSLNFQKQGEALGHLLFLVLIKLLTVLSVQAQRVVLEE